MTNPKVLLAALEERQAASGTRYLSGWLAVLPLRPRLVPVVAIVQAAPAGRPCPMLKRAARASPAALPALALRTRMRNIGKKLIRRLPA